MVDRLRQEYAGAVDVKTMDLSRGDAEVDRLATLMGVEYVPTFVFATTDGSVRNQVVGGLSEQELRAQLDALK